MPSSLTDEEYSRHCDEMRIKKQRCEKGYHICGAVIIGLAVFLVLPSIFSAFLHAMFRFEVRPIVETAVLIAMFLSGLFGIYGRNRFLTGASLVLMIIADGTVRQISGIPGILPYFTSAFSMVSAVILFLHYHWHKLMEEEGFPDFKISYEERIQQEKNQLRQNENRLLAEGAVRRTGSGDMTELLDDDDKPALPAELTAYKERFTLQTPKAGERQYTKGEMDEL